MTDGSNNKSNRQVFNFRIRMLLNCTVKQTNKETKQNLKTVIHKQIGFYINNDKALASVSITSIPQQSRLRFQTHVVAISNSLTYEDFRPIGNPRWILIVLRHQYHGF